RALHLTAVQACALPISFFQQCLMAVRADIKALGEQLKMRLNREEQALFDAYLAMLDDASLGSEVTERIRQGTNAPYAWAEVILRSEERRVGKGCRCRWA